MSNQNEPSDTPRTRWYEVLVSLTPLILGFCVSGVGVYFTNLRDDRQLQLNQLTALEKLRPMLESEKPQEREFGYQMFVALGYEKLALRLMEMRQDSAGRSAAQSIVLSGSASAKVEAKAVLPTLVARVYLHIGAESQRDRAKALQEALTQNGFSVQGIENVSAKTVVPTLTDVRYFNDQDKATAEQIADLLGKDMVAKPQVKRIGGVSSRPGSVEVWFAAGPL
jgi:hypothetical protein